MAEGNGDGGNDLDTGPWYVRYGFIILLLATVSVLVLRVWMTISYSPLDDDLSTLAHQLDKLWLSTAGTLTGLTLGKTVA